MHRNDIRVADNRALIRRLLTEEGLPASKLGSDVGGPVPLTQKRVYLHIRDMGLPTNVIPKPGGAKEQHLLKLLDRGYKHEDICQLFSLSQPALEVILRRNRIAV